MYPQGGKDVFFSINDLFLCTSGSILRDQNVYFCTKKNQVLRKKAEKIKDYLVSITRGASESVFGLKTGFC